MDETRVASASRQAAVMRAGSATRLACGAGAPSALPDLRPVAASLLILVLALLTGFLLLAYGATYGPAVFLVAGALALLPMPAYVGLALWVDRYEAEPKWMLSLALLWGASIAVLGAGVANDTVDSLLGANVGSVLSAPLAEELLKAVVLFAFFYWKADEFDGPVDGIVYAAMVGLGFACSENIQYYGDALEKNGAGTLALVFTVRGVLSPFSHPLFTGMTGLALGIATRLHLRSSRTLAGLAGLGLAVLLHAAWNASASAGALFVLAYLFVMVPAFMALLVALTFALRQEGAIVRAELACEVQRGLFGEDELNSLSTVRGRLRASCSAWTSGGRAAWLARREFHQIASELAFLRRRTVAGLPAQPMLEREYVRRLSVLRTQLTAHGSQLTARHGGQPAGCGGLE